MGDFLLDFRPREQRDLRKAAGFLRFFEDMRVEVFDEEDFGLVLTSSDDEALWGTHEAPDRTLFVALAGRIAVDPPEWAQARAVPGPGSLAGKIINRRYRTSGLPGVQNLSGNFVLLLHDRPAHTWFLLTDPWGLVPAFGSNRNDRPRVYSSHPDALADATGQSRNWDLTSFAEFILTGRLTAPHSYYQKIQALAPGTVTAISTLQENQAEPTTRSYVCLTPRPEPDERVDELAEEFAGAMRRAVARRTQPALGRSAIALSGGLDSRTVLCSVASREDTFAFSCFDTENDEFLIAQAIAREARVKFIPLRRSPDYYSDHAALGARISGGMGCIASNHFLGFRQQLRDLGAANLLTGCYCDYLFKGLALNKRVHPLTTQESLAPFAFAYYAGRFQSTTELARAVQSRLTSLFPPELQRYHDTNTVLAVEQRRIFPLSYEEDNAERLIPQRTMGWYVPVADQELLQIYLRQSCAMRLNRRLFVSMVQKVCGPRLCRIPDANTGVSVDASPLAESLSCHARRARRLLARLHRPDAADGSWLNWPHYVLHSRKLRSLWNTPNPEAFDIFRQVLGPDGFHPEIEAYRGRAVWLFLQLFTLKLWLDQRP
jgi:asparagine synthetase B (glutamine-hydrolysing)